MTGTGNSYFCTRLWQLLPGCAVVLAVAAFIFTAGCSTTSGQYGKPEADGPTEARSAKLPSDQQIAQLQAREKELERQIRSLKGKLKAEAVTRESLARRLEIAQAAREEAIREVVRTRARIQGMASKAEASAMFAEARVIVDRMEAEAFRPEARDQLDLARSYMTQGKDVLDTGNPGGAAYLFDLIPGLFEGMKNPDPRIVKINVRIAALREAPSSAAAKKGTLYLGESATGLEKNKDWIKVKTSSGQTGWIMKTQVQ